jgi:hypothetical protein
MMEECKIPALIETVSERIWETISGHPYNISLWSNSDGMPIALEISTNVDMSGLSLLLLEEQEYDFVHGECFLTVYKMTGDIYSGAFLRKIYQYLVGLSEYKSIAIVDNDGRISITSD